MRGVWGTLAVTAMVVAISACGEEPTPPTGSPTVDVPTDTVTQTPPVTDPPTSEDPVTSPEQPADVTASVERGAAPTEGYSTDQTGVWVRYTVTNTSDTPLLVLTDRGHAQSNQSSAPAIDSSAWVSGAEGGVARLSKQVFSAPSGVLPTDPWRAAAVLVESGESIDGELFAPEPLRTDLPAVGETLTHDEQPAPDEATGIEACIQVAPSPGPDAYNDEITMTTSDRSLVCSPALDLPE